MIALFKAIVLGGFRKNIVRSLVTLTAVALGTAVSLAINLANATAIASFSSSADIVSEHVNLQISGTGKGFDENALARVRALPGVLDAQPVAEGSVVIGARPNDPVSGEILRVQGIDALRPLPAREHPPSAHPDPYMLIAERGVLMPAATAERYRLKPGDSFEALAGARAVRLRVAALLPEEGTLTDSGVIFADVVTAQELFGEIGLLSRIDCIVDPAHLSAVAERIGRVLPPGARTIEPRVRTGEIQRMLNSFQSNLAALSYIALLIGMYLLYNTVAVSVVQRSGEIGTLRALGASRTAIFMLFLGEGMLFGICGSAIGLFLGASLAEFAVAAVTHTVSSLYVGTRAEHVVFDGFELSKAFFTGVLLATLSAIAPAREAASTPPAVSMRGSSYFGGDPKPDSRLGFFGAGMLLLALIAAYAPAIDGVPICGYAAALLAIFGGSLLAPSALAALARASEKLAGRLSPACYLGTTHLRASWRRNSVAVAALMIAVSMTTGIAVLVGSFRASVVAWENEALRADLFIRPDGVQDASFTGGFAPNVLASIRVVPGVAAADGFRLITIPFRGTLTTIGASDFRTLAVRNKLRFLGRPNVALLAARLPGSTEVLASEPFVTRFGAHVGDAIALSTPSGAHIFHIAAVYNDYSSDAGVLIMDARTFARFFHDDTVDSIAVYGRPGASVPALRTRLARALSPLRVTVETTKELRALVITIFNRTFSVTDALYVISLVIAVLGVMSTLFALVLERRRELALLRRLGLSLGDIRIMMLTEAGLIGFLGGIGGTLLGSALGLLLVFVIDRQSFGWLIELHMPYVFLAGAVVATVLFSLAAGLYPAEEAARTRTAEALRTE